MCTSRLAHVRGKVHRSTQSYPPAQFDGFRSLQMRQGDDEAAQCQAVSLCLDYILFKIGRHAWSVVMYFSLRCTDILISFAALVCLRNQGRDACATYDVKLEQEGVRPADHCSVWCWTHLLGSCSGSDIDFPDFELKYRWVRFLFVSPTFVSMTLRFENILQHNFNLNV
jgi:hypothetical protein